MDRFIFKEEPKLTIEFDEVIERLIDKEVENCCDGDSFIKFEDWKDIFDAMLKVTAYCDEEIILDVEDLDDETVKQITDKLKQFTKKDIDALNDAVIDAIEDCNYRLHWSKL